jgi:RNA polymerase sigma factor (sigma-70 family)
MTREGRRCVQLRQQNRKPPGQLATSSRDQHDGLVHEPALTNPQLGGAATRRDPGRSGSGPDQEEVAYEGLRALPHLSAHVTHEIPGDAAPLGSMLTDPPDSTAKRTDIRLLLWQQMRWFPPTARRILYQRLVEDRTEQEIAENFGFSEHRVSRLLNRYVRELRDTMETAA